MLIANVRKHLEIRSQGYCFNSFPPVNADRRHIPYILMCYYIIQISTEKCIIRIKLLTAGEEKLYKKKLFMLKDKNPQSKMETNKSKITAIGMSTFHLL